MQYESAYIASWVSCSHQARLSSRRSTCPHSSSPRPGPLIHGEKRQPVGTSTPAGPNFPRTDAHPPVPRWQEALLAVHFNLTLTTFLPMRHVLKNPPSGALISDTELREPAFHRRLFTLRIVHLRLSLWFVDLSPPAPRRL
ncbi:hypothetical protein MVEN_01172200 [Mycena venus]|uniref:Uncharacterized protein n=1 Tax=Mycena venus TaxID=2733690 RepID=A0A8H6Y455_9AGAR|nr:hypothetical protein MVEN_01172200 [Mycena venus]